MADKTGIEWTDATWNPLLGCSAVSPGCDHCYAERQTGTRLAHVPAYAGLTEDGKWTGEVRELPDRLDQPLRWRKPRRVFVNSMSDLFHPAVSDEYIARVFAVMGLARQHTFQILTKRPQRMATLLSQEPFWAEAYTSARANRDSPPAAASGSSAGFFADGHLTSALPNVWLGTSIESQQYAFRARHLADTPAAVRFVSAEPLLGPLDLTGYMGPGIDWLIVGGESGPGARPMHPEWARSLREQSHAHEVAFLFKQWGEWAPAVPGQATHLIQQDGRYVDLPSATRTVHLDHGRTRTEDLIDRGHPGWARIYRPGKKLAGRTLDGRTWDGYPG